MKRPDFARGLKRVRTSRGLTQEDFSDVSSRIYVSLLERGLKNPTLDKIAGLSEVMEIHPLSLLALSYLLADKRGDLDRLLSQVRKEVEEILDQE